ncbi:uncharacterized protein LOC122391926 [Amphibalanus amphitrite]|uniref:uncharacterized protein LOC122391926 n=1 Tax=Amphibalanus amphitrite TaxID=1232801 RepID=UPI001C90AAA4|nr:uncharacterized protein LOC122391926 [Amphibalanus amphitrite]
MPSTSAEYARLPVTELVDDLSSEEEDDLYTRPPRRHRHKGARNGKPSLQTAPMAFREAATRPVKRYQLLDEEDALGALQATPDIRQPRPLSVTKKACLVTACLLILTVISVAVWLVPCQWYGCSLGLGSGLEQSSVRRDYEVMFPGIMVTTRLLAAPTVYVDSADVVFGFRRQDSTAGGLMVVASSSGQKLWQQDLYEAPVDLRCGGLDLNSNGIFECLATGGSSMMALVNMDKRRVEWYLHEHNSTSRPLSLLPPVLLDDLTSDGVADLLVAGLLREDPDSDEQEHQGPPRSQLMLVDGASGMVLNKGPIADCPVLLRLSTVEDRPSDVQLECMSPQSGVVPRIAPLTTLTELLRTDDMPSDVRVFTASSKAGDTDGDMFQVQLENAGVCPRCRGRLTLLDPSGAAVWSTSAERARLHSVRQFNHRNHSGVVYKLWQYPDTDPAGALAPLRRRRRWWHLSEEEPERPVPPLTFEEEASVTQSSEGILFRYRHPGREEEDAAEDAPPATPEPDDGSVPEFFTESVHVVWPSADGQLTVRQLDSVQMTRFCRGPQQQRCQPPALADNVVTAEVLDVGADGDLDLVSVTSLFVPEGEVVIPRHRHQCSLQTRLRKRQLYGPHWRETLSEAVQPTTAAVPESVPTGDTPTAL